VFFRNHFPLELLIGSLSVFAHEIIDGVASVIPVAAKIVLPTRVGDNRRTVFGLMCYPKCGHVQF
jgi:hypothetical protein